MSPDSPDFNCPLPHTDGDHIGISHGGGGQHMHDLLARHILPRFTNPLLNAGTDAAVIDTGAGRFAFTTDSYVVNPPFFPGGDIGTLAVCGTLNDLATVGATPRWLSAGLIIEEGLPTAILERILDSMSRTARGEGIEIVTGDTKVVERGKGDGIYINTAGIGTLDHDRIIAPSQLQPGDAVLVSGDLGRHGIAVLAAREGMAEQIPVTSDVGSISPAIRALLAAGITLRCVRDLTRGGLVSALVEISQQSGLGLKVREAEIPVSESVQWACELLGFDPLYVANEGRFVSMIPADQVQRALTILEEYSVDSRPAVIGSMTGPGEEPLIESRYGPLRRLTMISGEQLPRIC